MSKMTSFMNVNHDHHLTDKKNSTHRNKNIKDFRLAY